MKIRFIVMATALLLTACIGSTDVEAPATTADPTPATIGSTTATAVVDPVTPVEAVPFDGDSLPTTAGSHFSASGACATCHTNMIDESGNDVSIDSTWRSSLMANAARDPYWLATVQAEITANPELAAVIEDKCSTCHMPMARTTDSFTGTEGVMFGEGYLNPANEMHVLAADGVSCTVCHQIDPANLGSTESFSGGFLVDSDTATGERVTYGPFEVSQRVIELMQGVSGFIPEQSEHIHQSEVCGTCHTLYTPYLDSAGEVAGLFPEQTALLELQASDVNQSCQDCHMPVVDGLVETSAIAADPRPDVNRHLFVGGNDFMLAILSTFGEELSLTASSDLIPASRDRVNDLMTQKTATFSLSPIELNGEELVATVSVSNTTGHKLPTGFPSRRVWVHLTVTDGNGEIAFESGAWQANGVIIGDDNDDDATAYEPHYDTITSSDQVQVYETILEDTEGAVTTTLLFGAAYAKDNRLLPHGFGKDSAPADIGVFGEALADPDFTGGGDEVTYLIQVDPSLAPFTVEAELLYQSVSYRWADNLDTSGGNFIADFIGYYNAVPNTPVVIASESSP